ncbi:unnamed protein product [Rotaria sp. Silwood2]|nr:unnamed protein product [Rotaria sp. Silwood2]
MPLVRARPIYRRSRNFRNQSVTHVQSNFPRWIKLLMSALIPLTILVFAIVDTILQVKLTSQQLEQDREQQFLLRKQSDDQVDIQQKDTLLATYLSDILTIFQGDDPLASLTDMRAITLATLGSLDPQRKKDILLFLYNNELIFRYPSESISTLLQLNGANFNGISLQGTIEEKCSFTRLYLYGTYLSNTSFIRCDIDHSNFSNAIMHRTLLSNTFVTQTSFNFAFLDKSRFINTKFYMTSFLGALLTDSNFTGSVWPENTVDFTNANLSGAILSNEQLQNSTLVNCILSNGTWGSIRTDNLVVNGDAERNCIVNGSKISNGWTVVNKNDIKTFAYPKQNNNGKCYFRMRSVVTTRKNSSMYQYINLENFTLLLSTGHARYNASADLQCFGKQYAAIELRFIDLYGSRYANVYKQTFNGTHLQSLELSDVIGSNARSVQILITFGPIEKSNNNATLDQNYCKCDNVKFSIMKS